jgi:RES domain-containing protein
LQLYRLAALDYPVFDGGGALRHSARWHTAGRRIIYCGPNLSCCRLELIANLGRAVLQRPYGYVSADVPEDVVIETKPPSELPVDWDHPRDHHFSQPVGNAWYDAGASLIVRVPSVASPGEFNALVNQDHPDFSRLVVSTAVPARWDERIFDPPSVAS